MQVLWSEDAEVVLLTLSSSDAERIMDATELLAETGRGFVRRMLDSSERRLYIEGYAITFHVEDGVMFVLRVRPSTPST